MNGSNYGDHLTADVTSYDYDALLTEDGQITEKYRRFQEIISRHRGKGAEPDESITGSKLSGEDGEEKNFRERTAYGTCNVSQKVDLFHALDCLAEPVGTLSPMSMERLGQSYGYTLYSSVLHTERQLHSIRLYQAADRAICFADGKRILTAMDRELLERHEVEPTVSQDIRLDILMENMGRVNYGPMINWQRKGIDGCVMITIVSPSMAGSSTAFPWITWRSWILPEAMMRECLRFTGLPLRWRRLEIPSWTAAAGERAVFL